MCGLANRRVIHVQIIANSAYHHLASVHPDADLHGDPFSPLDLGSILLHRRLHGQGGVARPHRMVFMGQGCAKQRHNAVP
jgi:hypothetical protein